MYIDIFVLSRRIQVLDGMSQNSHTLIIFIRIIFQLKIYVRDVHVFAQCVCMDVMLAYVCSE